jgi:dihydrofolate synthase/folylpolyglutamate synthase
MGLERVREVATRMGLGKPAKRVSSPSAAPMARARRSPSSRRSPARMAGRRRRLHLAAPAALQRARAHRWRGCRRRRRWSPVRGGRSRARRNALTYFEYGTLCALWLFARAKLDLAVLEVGLGGRLDAVNIVDADVAVITTVDLDHQDWLGDDIEAIGSRRPASPGRGSRWCWATTIRRPACCGHAYAIGAQSWRIANDFFAERIDARALALARGRLRTELPMPALARRCSCAMPPARSPPCARCPAASSGRRTRGRRQRAGGRAPAALSSRRRGRRGRCRPQPAGGARAGDVAARQPRRAPSRCMRRWPTRTPPAWSLRWPRGRCLATGRTGRCRAARAGCRCLRRAPGRHGRRHGGHARHPPVPRLAAALQAAGAATRVLVFGSFHVTAPKALRWLNDVA